MAATRSRCGVLDGLERDDSIASSLSVEIRSEHYRESYRAGRIPMRLDPRTPRFRVRVRVTFQSSTTNKCSALARAPTWGIPAVTPDEMMLESDVPFPPAPAGPAGKPSRKSGNDKSIKIPVVLSIRWLN